MTVIVRPKRRPVNRLFLAGGFAATLAWSLWPAPDTYWQADACFWMFAAATVGGFWNGALELIRDHRLRGAYAASERVTDDHGSAREATWPEVVKAGMAEPGSGNFLGLFAGSAPIFAPPKTPFALIEMPPGAGKTVNGVIGSILHRARLGARRKPAAGTSRSAKAMSSPTCSRTTCPAAWSTGRA